MTPLISNTRHSRKTGAKFYRRTNPSLRLLFTLVNLDSRPSG